MSHDPLLNVQSVVKTFGGFRALDGLSFSLRGGEILGLVGPNGSGKTTCINVISGLYRPDGGDVVFKGHSIAGRPLHYMAKLGINRTFQVPKPFKALTVEQNIQIVRARSDIPTDRKIEDPLDFVGLSHLSSREASTLTSGQQKLLDLARALATGPNLLLVDELAAGLSPAELDEVATKLHHLSELGIAMIVVEHLLSFVHQLTKRVIVMNTGKQIFEGDLDAAAKDQRVVEVYLGQ